MADLTPTQAAILIAGVQTLLVIALAVDKFIHRVTGATPLERRIEALETSWVKGNERLSEKWSELTTQLGHIEIAVAELKTEVRVNRQRMSQP